MKADRRGEAGYVPWKRRRLLSKLGRDGVSTLLLYAAGAIVAVLILISA